MTPSKQENDTNVSHSTLCCKLTTCGLSFHSFHSALIYNSRLLQLIRRLRIKRCTHPWDSTFSSISILYDRMHANVGFVRQAFPHLG